jgi:hypothetical protein
MRNRPARGLSEGSLREPILVGPGPRRVARVVTVEGGATDLEHLAAGILPPGLALEGRHVV